MAQETCRAEISLSGSAACRGGCPLFIRPSCATEETGVSRVGFLPAYTVAQAHGQEANDSRLRGRSKASDTPRGISPIFARALWYRRPKNVTRATRPFGQAGLSLVHRRTSGTSIWRLFSAQGRQVNPGWISQETAQNDEAARCYNRNRFRRSGANTNLNSATKSALRAMAKIRGKPTRPSDVPVVRNSVARHRGQGHKKRPPHKPTARQAVGRADNNARLVRRQFSRLPHCQREKLQCD